MTLITADKVIQIKRRSPAQTEDRPIILIDKFFLFGILCALAGTGYYGIKAWLIRSGILPVAVEYIELRELHSFIQIYFFIGSFILGFVFHAIPVLMGSRITAPTKTLIIIPVLAISLLLKTSTEIKYLVELVLSLVFLTSLLFLLKNSVRAKYEQIVQIAVPVFFGLTVLCCGTFLNLSDPQTALGLIWFGICPILFGTGQQFISGFLGGKRLAPKAMLFFMAVYLFSLLIFIFQLSSNLFCLSIGINLALYIYLTRATLMWGGSLHEPLTLAFVSGFIWLLVGWISLWTGFAPTDFTVHAWGMGAVVSIVMGTSSQILSFITSRSIIKPKLLWLTILCWQCATFARVLSSLLQYNSLIGIILVLGTMALLFWMVMAAKSIIIFNHLSHYAAK